MVNLGEVNGPFYAEQSSQNDAIVESTTDNQLLLQPVVGERKRIIGRLSTIYVAVIYLLAALSLGVFAVILSTIWAKNDKRECESYFYALYGHIIYWAISLIFDIYFRSKHTESRINGYLEFYKYIIKFIRTPYYISTTCNTLLLTLAAVFHQLYGDMTGHCLGNLLDPLHYVSAIIIIEIVAVCSVLTAYIVKIWKFNKQNACPDALKDDWMASFVRDSYSDGEVGYREKDNHIEDLLEKQADLLRYLKEQNSRLVEKVMILSSQLQEKHGASVT